MDDNNPKPDKSAGRRKRIAPTIDLEAKEIPPVAAAAATSETHASETEASEPETAAPETEVGPEAQAQSDAQMPPEDDMKKPEQARLLKPVMASAAAGAMAAAVVVAIAWSAGTFSGNGVAVPDPRVAALEAQIKELQNRPASVATGAPAANDTLTPRIAKVEDQLAKIAATPSNDAKTEAAMSSLGVALTALNRRYDELAASTRDVQARATAAEQSAAELRRSLQDVSKTAQAGPSSAEVTALQQRLAALEEQSKAARAELTKATESDKAARLALSAAAVRDAVLRGGPFAEELAQAKSLGASEAALAPLWPFAASGAPGTKTLSKELSDLLPAMRKAVAPPQAAPNGFLERLQANAEGLVRVRPAGSVAGEDASGAFARIEAALAREDVNAALTEIGTLPQAARQLAADWVTRAAARQKAHAAARDLAADSARSLGSR